jgi:hypothetical protein
MDWNALVLRPGDPVSAFGRLVRNVDGDWFEGPVPVPLMLINAVRPPMCAVPVIDASFTEVAGRHEFEGVVEGTAIVTGTWTGSAVRVDRQVAAAQPGADERLYQDRPPRTLRFHWTREEARDVRGHLGERSFEWNVYSSGIIGDHVEARLTRVLPEIAAWAATLPPGILALDPWLVPATERVGPVTVH